MTKILHVIQGLTLGGAGRALMATAKYSSALDSFQHRVLSLHPVDPRVVELARESGLAVVNAPNQQDLRREMDLADIVHVHFWNNPDIYALLRSELPSLRLLLWFHIAGDKPPQVLTPELIDFADFALACSPYTYEHRAFQSLPPDIRSQKTGMVYGATDFARVSNLPPKAHASFNVGYIGTVDFVKMHPRYVPMSAAVNVPQIKFIVCGGGIENILKSEAQQLGAGERFDFRGYVSDIRPVLEILDVYGYPLCEETYAAAELNLQEAMYVGIPPVVFPYGGLKRLVESNQTGLIVRSESEYKEAIEYLYHNPEERARLGKNASEYAQTHFGAENAAKALNPIYQRMLELPKRKRVWGGCAGVPLLDQTVTMKDLVGVPVKWNGAQMFVESLGDAGDIFTQSMEAEEAEKLLRAEEAIGCSSTLMRSGGSGGIIHYRQWYSNDAYLRLWTGLVCQKLGNYPLAISEFSAALDLGLNHWRVLWYLAQSMEKKGDSASAANFLEKVVQAAPVFSEARNALTRIRGAMGHGNPIDLLMERADQYYKKGHLQAAAESIGEALALSPDRLELLVLHGSLLFQLGDFPAAQRQLHRASELKADDPTIFVQLALANLKLDRIEEFEAALSHALKMAPDHREGLKLLADLNFKSGRLEDAAQAYGRILRKTPDDLEILLPLGVCFFKANDSETARTVFERVISLDPGNTIAKENLDIIRRGGPQPERTGAPLVAEPALLVSAIVSTYNSERFIRGCLQDLVDQTLYQKGQLEIIVVDSGSEQNEGSIVQEFQQRYKNITYQRTKRETLYAAWNRAVKLARGRYVTPANTDDRHRHDALEVMARVLDERAAGLAYADVLLTSTANETFDQNSAQLVWELPEYSLRQALMHCPFGSKEMWRRNLHDEIGVFDAGFTIAGDYEFFLRLARKHGAVHVADTLGLYYESQNNLSCKDEDKVVEEVNRFLGEFRKSVSLEEIYPFLREDRTTLGRAAALVDWANKLAWASGYPGLEQAAELYREAGSLLGSQPSGIQNNLALLFQRQGRGSEALQLLEEIVKIDPSAMHNAQEIQSGTSRPEWKLFSLPYPALESLPEVLPSIGRRIPIADYRSKQDREGILQSLAVGIRPPPAPGQVKTQAPSAGVPRQAEIETQNPMRLLAQADAEYQEGNLSGALQSLRAASKLAPDDQQIIASLGAVSFSLNDFDSAREAFQRLVQLKPDDPSAFLQLALSHLKLEHVEEFENALARALELDPYHHETLKYLAGLNFQQGSWKDAAQTYIKILSRRPNDVEALLAMGVCFFKIGDSETARTVFERVLSMEPANELAKENLEVIRRRTAEFKRPTSSVEQSADPKSKITSHGLAPAAVSDPRSTQDRVNKLIDEANFFDEAGNREAALESLEQAAELSPRDFDVLTALGSLHFNLCNYEAARGNFRRMIELEPRNPYAYTRLAMTCLKLNRIEEMEAALGIALEIDPHNRDALKFLAKTNLESNRVRDAGRVYAKLLEKQPEDVESLLTLGLCFYRGGDADSARMVYERVLEVDPENVTAHENLIQLGRPIKKASSSSAAPSTTEGASGQPEKSKKLQHWLVKADEAFGTQNLAAACDALKMALDLSPDTPEILSALGTLCFQLGNMVQASTYLRRLVQQVPGDPGHWARLALTHYELGEIEEFESALRHALAIDPNHLEALRLLANLNFNHASIADAAQNYGKILKQTPGDLEIIAALGVCFFKLRDYESAKMMFERMLELDPENVLARENLQAVQLKLPNVAAGVSPAVEPGVPPGGLDSRRSAAPTRLHGSSDGKTPPSTAAETPAATGQAGTALPLLDDLLNEANAQVSSGDLQSACQTLRRAAEIAPNDPDILGILGSLLYQSGDWPSSQAELARAAQLRPGSADLQTRWALSLLSLNRIAEFEAALGRALELDSNYAPALKLLADLNLQQGKFKDAADAYFRILRHDPDNINVILSMAVCFYKTDDIAAAQLMYERVLKLQPRNAIAQENLQIILDRTAGADGKTEPLPAPKAPLVSAIVSTYNSERFIRGCLEDLEAQTIADQLEIIVVDSGSQQHERSIVEDFQRRFSNIVYIRTEERETVYGAWNRGIRAARGKYLTNANTDDRHRKDAFEILAGKLDEKPGVALVYANVVITDEENKSFDTARRIGNFKWLEFDPEALVRQGCFVGPQPMWRRELHQEHGFFDPAFVSAGDYEFWMRLARTCEFLHVPQALGVYLKSPTSIEHSNRERAAEEHQMAISRHGAVLLAKAGARASRVQEPSSLASSANLPVIVVPSVAKIGSLKKVHDLLERKKYLKAWKAALEAISLRPFHPDAYLQMIEIALAAGDERQAVLCTDRLLHLAPKWEMATKIDAALKIPKKGPRCKIKWTPLPALPQKPRLSVCLIVKNEEQFIGQCLASVKPIASQIVVVDTGSTDRTVEIAKEYGAEVHHFAWNDNFSDARNAAHEHARGDWVLILDADEELPVDSHQQLAQDMAAANVLGYRIPICNLNESTESVTYVPRLFRNAPALFFVGRVHEQIYSSVVARKSEWAMEAKLGTATILHHGYDPGLVKRRQKVQRNLRLMERAIQEMPNEAALIMNYGLDLVNDGRLDEGLEKYREAVRVMTPHPADAVLPEVRERLVTLFGVHLVKASRYEELVGLLTSRLAADAGPTASMSFLAGLGLMRLNRTAEAIPHLRQCLATRHLPGLTPACQEILKAGPHHLLAECLGLARQNEEAESEFKRALEIEPRAAGILHDYARFLHHQGRSLEALQTLHSGIAQDLNDERLWALGGYIANSKPEFVEFALDWTEEAIKFYPENDAIAGFRGETLLKAGRLAEALPFFQKEVYVNNPAGQAAVILCQIAVSGSSQLSVLPDQEAAVSRELVSWYRRLLVTNAKDSVLALNAKIDQLRQILPTAASVLVQALAESESS